MAKFDDGGPAFPCSDGKGEPNEYPRGTKGMSLRDWFAGRALAQWEICAPDKADPRNVSNGDIAKLCYDQADAMIKEKRKREQA